MHFFEVKSRGEYFVQVASLAAVPPEEVDLHKSYVSLEDLKAFDKSVSCSERFGSGKQYLVTSLVTDDKGIAREWNALAAKLNTESSVVIPESLMELFTLETSYYGRNYNLGDFLDGQKYRRRGNRLYPFSREQRKAQEKKRVAARKKKEAVPPELSLDLLYAFEHCVSSYLGKQGVVLLVPKAWVTRQMRGQTMPEKTIRTAKKIVGSRFFREWIKGYKTGTQTVLLQLWDDPTLLNHLHKKG